MAWMTAYLLQPYCDHPLHPSELLGQVPDRSGETAGFDGFMGTPGDGYEAVMQKQRERP